MQPAAIFVDIADRISTSTLALLKNNGYGQGMTWVYQEFVLTPEEAADPCGALSLFLHAALKSNGFDMPGGGILSFEVDHNHAERWLTNVKPLCLAHCGKEKETAEQ